MPAELRLFPEESQPPDDPAKHALGVYPTGSFARSKTDPLAPGEESPAPSRALGSVPVSSDGLLFPSLSPAERETARGLSLSEYYQRFLSPWHDARIAAGKPPGAATVSTYRTHLQSYDRWEREREQAAELPATMEERIAQFFGDSIERGHAGTQKGKPWSAATAASCWKSLRIILGYAQKHGLIESAPCPDLTALADDEDRVTPYTDEQLGKLYAVIEKTVAASSDVKSRSPKQLAALRKRITLQMRTLIVLITNCGPRAEDAFLLRWEEHVRLNDAEPRLVFRASKTQKRHVIPLAAITIEHLTTLRHSLGILPTMAVPLFPDLVNQHAKDPLDSAAKRRATKLIKAATAAIGLDAADYRCPWHAIRKSCTTRFNAHGRAKRLGGDVGEFITHGPDASVASRYYDQRLPSIREAVETIGWPF